MCITSVTGERRRSAQPSPPGTEGLLNSYAHLDEHPDFLVQSAPAYSGCMPWESARVDAELFVDFEAVLIGILHGPPGVRERLDVLAAPGDLSFGQDLRLQVFGHGGHPFVVGDLIPFGGRQAPASSHGDWRACAAGTPQDRSRSSPQIASPSAQPCGEAPRIGAMRTARPRPAISTWRTRRTESTRRRIAERLSSSITRKICRDDRAGAVHWSSSDSSPCLWRRKASAVSAFSAGKSAISRSCR